MSVVGKQGRMRLIALVVQLCKQFKQNITHGKGECVKRRNRWHSGAIIFDCQHFHPYRAHWEVNQRRWCNRCGELHAVLFVIPPRPKPVPKPRDPNQLTLDDIPPF